MKKMIVWALAACLIFALSACGNKETPQASAPSTGAAAGSTASGSAGGSAGGAQEVKLVATNFQFDQKEYHVKTGSDVKVSLENKEGLHGVTIKDFNVKLDNNTKTASFKADKPGTYDIICAIPCGSGHLNMKSKLVVE